MKSYLWIFMLFTIFLIYTCRSIDYGHYIKIKATDASGITDSVVFELQEGATIGLDSELGEQDISILPGNPIGLDLRIIHRNIITCSDSESEPVINYWLCGNPGVLTFEDNFEFKREIRGIDFYNDIRNAFDFVVKVQAVHYPVVVTIEEALFELEVPIAFYDLNNYSIDSITTNIKFHIKHHPDDIVAPVYIINNEAENHLIGFSPILLSDVFEEGNLYHYELEAEMVYPNPESNIITIVDDDSTSEVTQDIQFSTFDEYGNFVQLYIFPERAPTYDLDISEFVPGTYYIRQNINLNLKRFIKL